MEPKDSLSFEIFGMKASATGRFAIVAVLSAGLVYLPGYFAGRFFGLW